MKKIISFSVSFLIVAILIAAFIILALDNKKDSAELPVASTVQSASVPHIVGDLSEEEYCDSIGGAYLYNGANAKAFCLINTKK